MLWREWTYMFTSKRIYTENKFFILTPKAVLTHITYRVDSILLIFYFEKSRNLSLKKLYSSIFIFFLTKFEIHYMLCTCVLG